MFGQAFNHCSYAFRSHLCRTPHHRASPPLGARYNYNLSKRLSSSPSNRELTIVCGAARSGTTLLHALVGAHPHIHDVVTEQFGWGYHQQLIAQAAGISSPDTPERMRRMLEAALTKTRMRQSGAKLDIALSLVDSYPSDWDHLMLIVVEAMRLSAGIDHIAVKTPFIESDIFFVDEFFRGHGWTTRWLYSFRHPFDVYLSFRERSPHWRRTLSHCDTLRWCADWLDSTSASFEASRILPVDRFRMQRFEDLLAEPRETCRELCQWMGLDDASEQMILGQRKVTNTAYPGRDVAYKTGSVRDLRQRTRVDLSDAEASAIRLACGLRARAFGYDIGPLPRPRDKGFVKQSATVAQLPAREYVRFVIGELARRAMVTTRTGYSFFTGRKTVSHL